MTATSEAPRSTAIRVAASVSAVRPECDEAMTSVEASTQAGRVGSRDTTIGSRARSANAARTRSAPIAEPPIPRMATFRHGRSRGRAMSVEPVGRGAQLVAERGDRAVHVAPVEAFAPRRVVERVEPAERLRGAGGLSLLRQLVGHAPRTSRSPAAIIASRASGEVASV